ncbi:hypothetical protein [Zavarzinella formosa]|uniref:hypothetical protein n=1 Tax=Zavarzinella formosa TaxID=360055 RepID=UPI0002E500A9|nr:hypothetical protein [Zavarzinella formosa]
MSDADSPAGQAEPVVGLDHGPFYIETPDEIRRLEPYPGWVAEPWNTVTGFFFVLIVLVWVWRLRGRYREYPFLSMALPLLFVGGVGGTLYHGLRNWTGFFLLDVVPIYLLGLMVSLYLWIRLGPKLRYLFGILAVLGFLQLLGHWKLPHHWAINMSYAGLAIIILSPIVIVLIRTKFRDVGWIVSSLACFGLAWLCRIADTWRPPLLPMGTHWLWHTFGALTTIFLIEYLYRIAKIGLRKPA